MPETESAALERALDGQQVSASALARTELRRAVARVTPERDEYVDDLLAQLRLVRLDDQLLDEAGRLEPPELRALDAIHIASALLLGDELEALVTYDGRQADAARACGLAVYAPA